MKGISFGVAVALDRARRHKEARHDFVRHLSEGEQQDFYRCCENELGLKRDLSKLDESMLPDPDKLNAPAPGASNNRRRA